MSISTFSSCPVSRWFLNKFNLKYHKSCLNCPFIFIVYPWDEQCCDPDVSHVNLIDIHWSWCLGLFDVISSKNAVEQIESVWLSLEVFLFCFLHNCCYDAVINPHLCSVSRACCPQGAAKLYGSNILLFFSFFFLQQ